MMNSVDINGYKHADAGETANGLHFGAHNVCLHAFITFGGLPLCRRHLANLKAFFKTVWHGVYIIQHDAY